MTGDRFARDAEGLDRELLEQVEAAHLGSIRCLTWGEVLHWQGDPVEYVFVVRTGSLKEYTLLADGRAYAFRVLGAGGLAGATAYLLGHDHDTITQTLDEVQVIALQPSEFDRLLARNPCFSSLPIKKLAQSAQSSADKARDLGFLDVQQASSAACWTGKLENSSVSRKAWNLSGTTMRRNCDGKQLKEGRRCWLWVSRLHSSPGCQRGRP